MIIEIIVIILSFLITGYGIYRYGGNEVAGQEIVAPGNGGVQNDVNIPIVQNDNNNNIHINPNININNIINNENNENNENNDAIALKNQIIAIIQKKEEKKNIDWGDLEKTASDIKKGLTGEAMSMVQDPSAEIKKILNEEKLERGKKAVNNWLEKNNVNIVNIENKDIQKIVEQFHNSEENDYTFKVKESSFPKFLLTRKEINYFLNKIKEEEEKKLSSMPGYNGACLQKQKNEMEELERQAQMEEEKILEEEKKWEEIDRKAIEAQKKIGKEPDQNNPDAITIRFKYPNGSTYIDRRFLKSHKIQNLYDFVTSLGRVIYIKDESLNGFYLSEPSLPPKRHENMKNSLDEEGICSNTVLQINLQ